jgi:copper chaperone CopZ
MRLIKTVFASAALSLLAVPAFAEHHMDHSKMDHSAHADVEIEADENIAAAQTITAKVNGLVCDFCAQAVRKVFKKQDGVESVNVDLDTGEIILGLKAGATLDDETISKLIRKSGYSLVSIDRGGDA